MLKSPIGNGGPEGCAIVEGSISGFLSLDDVTLLCYLVYFELTWRTHTGLVGSIAFLLTKFLVLQAQIVMESGEAF